jgi:hypothetical protein
VPSRRTLAHRPCLRPHVIIRKVHLSDRSTDFKQRSHRLPMINKVVEPTDRQSRAYCRLRCRSGRGRGWCSSVLVEERLMPRRSVTDELWK